MSVDKIVEILQGSDVVRVSVDLRNGITIETASEVTAKRLMKKLKEVADIIVTTEDRAKSLEEALFLAFVEKKKDAK